MNQGLYLDIPLPPSPAVTESEDLFGIDYVIPIPPPASLYWQSPHLHFDITPTSTTSSFINFIITKTDHIMSSSDNTNESGQYIQALTQENHHLWKSSMLSHFLEHNLDSIVDGTELKPAENLSAELANWNLRNKKAAGFMARKMDSYNRDLLLNDDNRKDAKALWEAITLEYSSTKARNRPGRSTNSSTSTVATEI